MGRTLIKLCLIITSYFLFMAMSCDKEDLGLLQENISSTIKINEKPLIVKDPISILANINISNQNEMAVELEGVTIQLSESPMDNQLKFINLVYKGIDSTTEMNRETGRVTTIVASNKIHGKLNLSKGTHNFQIQSAVHDDVNLITKFQIIRIVFHFKNKVEHALNPNVSYTFRPALKVRAAGQDNCDTYRIPGMITTKNGTLIMVYDNRYNNSKDLQEDVDIGMSRSTDGGQSWQPMKVIMDMGEYGGRSQRLNGVGDPAILYDPYTHTIWVAALWMSGLSPDKMLWWASMPGMTPEETGQFILSKSTDDGLTWSEPINITSQIKKSEWQLLLQGPGMGITLKDGTLVFPAQFKEDIGEKAIDGGQYTSHSTIVYSNDKGDTWKIGSGAKPNTTEAQVVQLQNGDLMLNMRDDKNRKDKGEANGRAVAVSKDLGKTWVMHPSSNKALPEPNCMASLIATNFENKKVLLFSNPNDKNDRINMTIKASFDEGLTWPIRNQIKLNGEKGYGYSCMTMIDNENIGIVYEGVKDLYFQKISIKELLAK